MTGSKAKHMRAVISRLAMGVCALALVVSTTGCSLLTPGIDQVQTKTVTPKLTADDLVEDGYLTVAMDTSNTPQAFNESTDEVKGYYADLAKALAERSGLKLKIVSASSAKNSVGNKKADIFIGEKTATMGSDLTMIGTVLDNGSALFTKVDSSKKAPEVSVSSLSGSTIAVIDGKASQDALERADIDADQKTFTYANDCFEALEQGKVDYVACDATVGCYLSRAYSGAQFVGTISSSTSYGIAAAKNSNVAEEMKSLFEEMTNDGTITALHSTWYGNVDISLANTVVSGVTVSSSNSSTSSEDSSDDEDSSSMSASGSGSTGTNNGQIGESINKLN